MEGDSIAKADWIVGDAQLRTSSPFCEGENLQNLKVFEVLWIVFNIIIYKMLIFTNQQLLYTTIRLTRD